MAATTQNVAKDLKEQGDYLYEKRGSLMSLWQETAEQFYPERANFTAHHLIGRNLADNLTTSYPIMCRRDLGNIISGMIRPSDQEWFKGTTKRPDLLDNSSKQWLERATKTQRRAMYDPVANFVRATKEGDHDYVTFGQCAISVMLNRLADALVYKTWHLRDMAWAENNECHIDTIHRKWKPTGRDMVRQFDGNVSEAVKRSLSKEPFKEWDCRHVILPSDWDGNNRRKRLGTQYVSYFFDDVNNFTMDETGVHTTIYAIPRWQTVSGSQYAYSMAALSALPDARLIQAITLVLLEAGEKAVNPPMIAPADTIRSDIAIYAGGVTIYDADYDEHTGEVLRPLNIDKSGLNFGMELRKDVEEKLQSAWFLNKIGLPPIGRDMTAFEVGQRVSEYVRNALPLFEPMETEYNSQICDLTFDLMFRSGAFGSARDMPNGLRGADIAFTFDSPLSAAIDSQKATKFGQALGIISEASSLNPAAPLILKNKGQGALRDALEGSGTPAAWLEDDSVIADQADAAQKQAAVQQQVAQLGAGADAANKAGVAAQNLGLLPPPGAATRSGTPAPMGA